MEILSFLKKKRKEYRDHLEKNRISGEDPSVASNDPFLLWCMHPMSSRPVVCGDEGIDPSAVPLLAWAKVWFT